MFCLDDYDIDLYGTEIADEWAFVDLIFLPCNIKESVIFGDEDDSIDPQCVKDLEKQVEYVGGLNFLVLTNDESFVQDQYGEFAVDLSSKIINVQTDPYTPSWIPGLIQTDVLQDEIDFI